MSASSDSMTIHHQFITFVYRQNCYPHTSNVDQPPNFCGTIFHRSASYKFFVEIIVGFQLATPTFGDCMHYLHSQLHQRHAPLLACKSQAFFVYQPGLSTHPQTHKIHIIHPLQLIVNFILLLHDPTI